MSVCVCVCVCVCVFVYHVRMKTFFEEMKKKRILRVSNFYFEDAAHDEKTRERAY